ncbi:MAG: hypothetical protein ACJ70Z_02515 [Nitrososphaera sp.]
MRDKFSIKPRKSPRKVKPANEVSEDDINTFLQAIRNFDGYPKLRTLRKMLPSLTPLQLNVIVHYLERSGMIVIDADGYITWMRNEDPERLTLGEVADISSDLKELLKKHPL